MNNDHLQRVLRLITRTGDKGFIVDETRDEIFAIMNIDSYEDLLDVAETKDNSPKDDAGGMDDYVLDDIIDIEEKRRQENGGLNVNKTVFSEPAFTPKPETKLEFNENWAEKDELKNNSISAEESLSDVPHDEEEEEKFYLEPVE